MQKLKATHPDLPVLVPPSDAYEAELYAWNKDVIHRPAVIAKPKDAGQVSAALLAAKQAGARIVIAGGRHGHDCLADGAFVIDLSRMTDVTVDAEAKVVTVGGGAHLGDMDRACAPFGLAAVTGTNPDTGVVGLSIAGGSGYLARWHGMAVDNCVSAEVVLASGEVVLASREERADLLWGLAGAGSNFGVVTARLHPVDQVYGGQIINVAPTPSLAATVLAQWRGILDSPHSVYSAAVLPCGAPVVPVIAVECDSAAVKAAQAGGAKLSAGTLPGLSSLGGAGCLGACTGVGKNFGALLSIKQLKLMQYHTELQPMLEDVQVAGYWYDAACMVPELSQEVIATLVSFTHDASLAPSAVLLFPLRGACAEAAVESTSFWGAGARGKAAFWIIIQGGWTPGAAKDPEGERRATVARWVKGLRDALSAFGCSETAHPLEGNMERADVGDRLDASFGPNRARIEQVKQTYDPTNLFQCNRNIPTKAARAA